MNRVLGLFVVTAVFAISWVGCQSKSPETQSPVIAPMPAAPVTPPAPPADEPAEEGGGQ